MRAARDRGRIAGQFSVQVIVQPGIDAQASYTLAQAAIHLSGSDGTGRHAAAGIREAPGRRRIPNVLNRWIVVQGDSEDQRVVVVIGPAKHQVMGVAYIGVVEAEVVGCTIIGKLNERPCFVGRDYCVRSGLPSAC